MKRNVLCLNTAAVVLLLVCRVGTAAGPAPAPGHLPLVLVHGFLASGDSFESQAMRFRRKAFKAERIHLFDWNSLSRAGSLEALAAFIDAVLEKNGAEKILLAGHSAGAGLCYEYLKKPENAAKVSRYAHLAGRPAAGPAGPEGRVPTLNVYSRADFIVRGADIPGARNVSFDELDHYQVATSTESFAALVDFFGQSPPHGTVYPEPSEMVKISGKALTLGENRPCPGALVELYQLDPASGFRLSDQADAIFTVDERGTWGPLPTVRAQPVELVLTVPGQRPVHYYRRGFATDSHWVYLRAMPPASSMAGMLLAALPADDRQTVVGIFSASRAVIHGRDRLEFNGVELSSAELAPASAANIAWFLYDADGNGHGDGRAIPVFSMAPFLTGVDMYIEAGERKSLSVSLNGETIRFQNWKSASEGLVMLVFD